MVFIEVQTESSDDAALINPEQVVALATPDHRPDLRLIYLMAGGKCESSDFHRNEIATTAPLEALLKSLGPFVRVKKFQPITGNPWNIYYLRLAAIASVVPLDDHRARVNLIDGRELLIEDGRIFRDVGAQIIRL